MANAARRLKYEDYADNLPALLDRVAQEHEAVELERRDGTVLRIETVDEAVIPHHDPEAVRAMLTRTAGALEGVDGEALKRELREMRQQDSYGRPA
jgi:hypothetical protein